MIGRPGDHRVLVVDGGAVGVVTALFLSDKGTLSGEAEILLLINDAAPIQTAEDTVDIARAFDAVHQGVAAGTRI